MAIRFLINIVLLIKRKIVTLQQFQMLNALRLKGHS